MRLLTGEGKLAMPMKDRDTGPTIRKAHGSGRWFPGTERALREDVAEAVENATLPAGGGRVVSGIAPHAGYAYSGHVAGHTFRAARDGAAPGYEPEIVVILGFSHSESFRGVALMDGDAIETPLGRAALDRDAADLLKRDTAVIVDDYERHIDEHSAENEIPFAQYAFPGVPLVVGLVNGHDEQVQHDVVDALRALEAQRRVLLIASSDMLHDSNYEHVRATDAATLAHLEAMNIEELKRTWRPSHQTLCGVEPVSIAAAFAASLGCKEGAVLCYANSGDDRPESRHEWNVGYGSVVFVVS